jgi:RHS repeat-associated protein
VNPFQYSGQYQDSESTFYYLRARYYDPSTEQFVTRDPISMRTRAPYAYVLDTPLNGRDPSGLDEGASHTNGEGRGNGVGRGRHGPNACGSLYLLSLRQWACRWES